MSLFLFNSCTMNQRRDADTTHTQTADSVDVSAEKDQKTKIIVSEGTLYRGSRSNGGAVVLKEVEQMPSFIGGDKALNSFVEKNLKYPERAKEEGINGRVHIRFVVEETGDISNAMIVKPLHSSCDIEALKLVKSMPRWNPGRDNGKPVSVYVTLPLTFKFDESNVDADYIYYNVDVPPIFKGNIDRYIENAIPLSDDNTKEGVISAKFVVEKDGSISNVTLIDLLAYPDYDNAFIDAIKSMPAWLPATIKRKAVRCHHKLSIRIEKTNN